jgi:hypothetical protein
MGPTNERTEMLTETSPELLEALDKTLARVFGRETILVDALHTGGGTMVAAADLSHDGRFAGRQVWLTRDDEREWLLGFYDYALDPDDEGLCVTIRGYNVYGDRRHDGYSNSADDPTWVAAQVAGILERLGVTSLQGES